MKTGNYINFLAAALVLLSEMAAAQAPPRTPVLPGGLITAGTTTQDRQGRWWAYVRWMPSKLEVLRGKQFAIYVKPGPADAAGTFTRQAIVTPQDTDTVIAPMLERAQQLGEDLSALSGLVNELLVHLGAPAPSGSLASRLASLNHRALGDASLQSTLWRMAAASPALTLVLGNGWAGLLPGNPGDDVTLEIREWTAATQSAAPATGRLLLRAAQPLPLPAPGAPVQVMDTSSSGDLVIRLRWAVEDGLRRQLPHLQGFNVWRVPQAVAHANGWNVAPFPSAAVLDAAPEVSRLNGSAPLLIGKLFRAADVANFNPAPSGDPDSHFIADDNNRWSGGTAFNDGDSFLYYTAARDLLGRSGELSPAGTGTACRRLPPSTPIGLVLENVTYSAAGTDHQCLRLKWQPNPNIQPGNTTHRYEIFRCDEAQTINSAVLRDPEALAAENPVASVPQPAEPGAWLTWDDLLAPESAFYGKTFWYGVRAVYDGACGPVVSMPAGPVFGTIAKQQAPEPFTRSCTVTNGVYAAALLTGQRDLPDAPPLNPNERHLRVIADRLNNGVAAVALVVRIAGQESPALDEIVRFDANDNTVDTELVAPANALVTVNVAAILTSGATGPPAAAEAYLDQAVNLTRTFHAVVAARSASDLMPNNALDRPFLTVGPLVVTPAAVADAAFLQGTLADQYNGPVVVYRLEHGGGLTNLGPACANTGVLFFADPAGMSSYRAYGLAPAPLPPVGEGSGNHHVADAADGSITPLRLRFALTPGTAEYRIFRSIDSGELHMIAQGRRDYSAVMPEFEVPDGSLPANSSYLDYFAQLLDVNGIPGRLIPIGSRVWLDRTPPRPTLGDPEATGDAAAPMLRIPWSCPPAGVERFEVSITEKSTGKSTTDNKVILKTPFLTAKPLTKPERQRFTSTAAAAVTATKVYRPLTVRILTGRVGTQDFPPGPGFEISVGVVPNIEYSVSLRAISVTGCTGPVSVERVITWRTPPPDEQVAWPARPVPEPVAFHSGIKAENITTLQGSGALGMKTAGILVGISPPLTRQPTSVDTGHGLRLVFTRGHTAAAPDFQTWLFPFEKGPSQRRGERLENLVLYRRQEPNEIFPDVSGDLLQVSSLTGKIGSISYQMTADLDATALMDPFFSATVESSGQPPNEIWRTKLYLLDPQPQIAGALYHYFLVRFTTAGEVDLVIDAGTLTINDE